MDILNETVVIGMDGDCDIHGDLDDLVYRIHRLVDLDDVSEVGKTRGEF